MHVVYEKFKFFRVHFPLNFLELFFLSTWRLVSLVEIPGFFEIFSCFILINLGHRIGTIGLYCLAFLFLPVARGSVLLRLIDIPFEQAIRYHVWLGHFTMLLFTLHGLLFVIAWTIEGTLLQEVSANGITLFLVHSHIYTCVILLLLYIYIYIYLLVFLPREEYIYNHWKLNYPLAIYIYTQKECKGKGNSNWKWKNGNDKKTREII